MITNSKHSNLKAKVGILGDYGIGKAHLLFRFTQDKFGVYYSLPGAAFSLPYEERIIDIDGTSVSMQLHGTHGVEKHRALSVTYYRSLSGAIVSYAVNNRESFNHVEEWMEEVITNSPDDVCKILVATRSDVNDRCVDYKEGKRLADKYGVRFFEISAKQGDYVEEVFYELASQAKKAFREVNKVSEPKKEILLETENKKAPKSSQTCC